MGRKPWEALFIGRFHIIPPLFIGGTLPFYFRLFLLEKTKRHIPESPERYRFAVLFPAYDEDEVILHSVEDFLRQEYPRDKYDIIVISDHMSDEMNERLRDLSAKVVKITEEKHQDKCLAESDKVHRGQARGIWHRCSRCR